MGSRLGQRTEAPPATGTVGMWQVDASTSLASLDRHAAAMLKVEGHSPDRPVHLEEAMRHLQEEDRDQMREIHLDVTRSGGPFLSEFRVIDAEGEIRWIQCRGQYALGTGGVMTGRGVLVDVTDIHAWSGPIPSQSAAVTVRPPPVAALAPASDPLGEAAELAVELRKTLGRTGHGALRLAADLLLWEINTAIAERHVISDKAVPGLSRGSR
ncbi:PAS domain-containing protein [Methylobacterium komagatae]